ncbi:hypothetical protein LMG23992_04880 [Cupriavidus laharis]|uniref:Uncharacterized protein n=1 Tax=Cupriavidus laharis TaxID=151654 RepID=A0ABM8XRT7_9BURK|nr:hypothetical protein [Cupriavidus laharis]CAG9183002.1 hypothetical protein LMG23992_04880 [Cupriavidus laharis]
MGLCVTLAENGTLQALTTPPDSGQCTGYVLVTATEYLNSQVLHNLFDVPTQGQLQAAFALGFTLPMTAYLVAYCVARIVSMFDK